MKNHCSAQSVVFGLKDHYLTRHNLTPVILIYNHTDKMKDHLKTSGQKEDKINLGGQAPSVDFAQIPLGGKPLVVFGLKSHSYVVGFQFLPLCFRVIFHFVRVIILIISPTISIFLYFSYHLCLSRMGT